MEQVSVTVLPDGRLDRRNAAAFLGRSPKTLADWARLGLGPIPRKVGGRVFYRLQDLEAFRDSGAREAA
jgi:hypothetical protein